MCIRDRFLGEDLYSDVESLPFEFGIDSDNGSAVSLRNISEIGDIRPFFGSRNNRQSDIDEDKDCLLYTSRCV